MGRFVIVVAILAMYVGVLYAYPNQSSSGHVIVKRQGYQGTPCRYEGPSSDCKSDETCDPYKRVCTNDPRLTKSACVNNSGDTDCYDWASAGDCTNSQYSAKMALNCKKSCGSC